MFGKSRYSDLEIQEILQTLFEEKKKVKELELKLKNSSLSPPIIPNEDTKKSISVLEDQLSSQSMQVGDLQKLLITAEEETGSLKKQLAEIKEELHQSKEKHPHQKEVQLERALQFMRQKVDEQQLEHQELINKYAATQEELKKLSFELLQSKEIQHKLSETIQKEKQNYEEIYTEEEALKAQLEQLKNILSQLQDQNTVAVKDKEAALKDAKEQHDLHTHSQREIELLRQMMMKTLQEFKDERQKEEQTYEDKIKLLQTQAEHDQLKITELTAAIHELTTAGNSLQESLTLLEKQNLEAKDIASQHTTAHGELVQFTEDLKQKLLKAEEQKQSALESQQRKEEQMESLNAQIAHLSHSLADVEESLEQAQHERQEHESRLRVAQQHLAKKVREATNLSEKNEELKLRIIEIEQTLENTKGKLLESQTSLDAQTQHQKKLFEQHQENMKTIESQAAKWEEKYFLMHERWQEVEARNRELKKLEERFAKLQQVLGHLGTLLSPLTHPAIETIIETKTAEVEMTPPAAPCATVQTNLFEPAPSTPRFKETFFT